jgi:hypothetical protein
MQTHAYLKPERNCIPSTPGGWKVRTPLRKMYFFTPFYRPPCRIFLYFSPNVSLLIFSLFGSLHLSFTLSQSSAFFFNLFPPLCFSLASPFDYLLFLFLSLLLSLFLSLLFPSTVSLPFLSLRMFPLSPFSLLIVSSLSASLILILPLVFLPMPNFFIFSHLFSSSPLSLFSPLLLLLLKMPPTFGILHYLSLLFRDFC